ncbi:hypothetical protein MRX96_003953 [Rhipicephalus microplus]
MRSMIQHSSSVVSTTFRLPPPLEETPCTIVETVDQLKDMCEALSKETEIAVDLEHHSYRSFQGFTCLMQISSRTHDYIVDALALRHELQMLNEVFADPKIVKVFHGADMDVLWLQRDFGLYLVGLFDTGQAAKVLGLAHFSLAFLLKHYCQIEADKQFQLADWRIRPLPPVMISYAQSDTHYLLYIMDRLKRDLADRSNENDNLLRSVFDRSKQVALRRYEKPSCHEQTGETRVARIEDESTGYVLPNHMILEISEILPRERQGIMACCNPCPPLVQQNLNELHAIILKAREVPLNERSVPEQSSWPEAVQVDLDSVLHCVHDRPKHDDATLALPTLLDEDAEPLPAKKPSSQLLTKAVPSLEAIAAKIPHTKPRRGTFVLPYKRYMAAVERDGTEVEASQVVTATGESAEPRVAKVKAEPGKITASFEDAALTEPLRSPRKTPRRQRGKRKRQEPDVGLLPDGQTYNSAQVIPSDEKAESSSRGETDFKPFDYSAHTPQAPKEQKNQPWSYNPEGPNDMKAGKRKRRRQQVKSRTFGSSSGEPVAKWPKR